MSTKANDMWSSLLFYRAYLPPAEALRATQYVVLGLEKGVKLREDDDQSPHTPVASHSECDTFSLEARPDTGDSDRSFTNFPEAPLRSAEALDFYLFKKADVSPPFFNQMLEKMRCCFLLCPKRAGGRSCPCRRAHLLDATAWHLKLSSFDTSTISISCNCSVLSLTIDHVVPTAGFLFACGLVHEGVVDAVQPVLCRYNESCRYGSRCLFVHANIAAGQQQSMTASTPLKSFLNAVAGANAFVTILEDIGLRTVGDVQELSNDAFDALVSRSQPQWLGQWLSVSVLREIQPKAMLNDVLIMFPGITTSVLLPPKLVSVRSLVDLSAREFYALDLDLKTVSACEKIRARFLPDRGYRIIDLKKEPQDSFFTHITPIILSFSSNNTHYSWRKNDPKRPVVTSLITYVNPTECSCRSREYGSCRSQLSPLRNGNWHSESTFPKHAWCTCPRMHVIAVNYELSTPSGSRCSEQNALGKLASTGLPTTVVREVFVYGDSSASKTETNPLFPCGVCENMLRKVSNDVFRQHGGDVMLYMFDSTTRPRKLIYLPIPEISFRDDRGFRKFVAELREL